MKNPLSRCLLVLSFFAFASVPGFALPRDAAAVLNRCGKPLKGDEIILDNSVAGGHRALKYERGTLHFDKVAMDGWTFIAGDHRKLKGLDAEHMAKYMPCLTDGLADSAKPEPIKLITATKRLEQTAKRDFKYIILSALVFLAFAGLILWLMSKRTRPDEVEEAY